ncbi:unnamed protein product [Xylocopa violacea]|uniref:CCDC113/CCDC96 coiled-coil domain-containing protein n=1 Tax=Xylocopa violacea TaxID=135666 RepID=A0ABP1N3D5_XYLVO
MAAQERKLTFDLLLEQGGISKMPNYNFDVPAADIDTDEIDDFMGEGEGEEGIEEWEGEEESEKEKKSTDEESLWDVIASKARIDEGEKYEGAFYDEEEVGEEEEILSTTVSTVEKLEEEARPPEEPDHVLPEIPAEVLAERETIISKIKELQSEMSELKRRNRMLELWVSRNLKKTQQRMTPSDPAKSLEQMEEVYKETLREYKIQVDDILSQKAGLTYELQSYTQKIHALKEEDYRAFEELQNYEREVAVGLIYAKTGKKITEKAMNSLIRRQIARRQILARDRQRYILLQHHLENLHTRLRIAETLGEGMTTMDYEALHVANVGYKDRLDERDRELEKLRNKISETVNGVAQFKEKEVCIVEDIRFEEENLEEYSEEHTKVRERLNKAHTRVNEIRDALYRKRIQAGLLIAPQQLIDMEKTMKENEEFKTKIAELEREIQMYGPTKRRTRTIAMSDTAFV